MRPPRTLFRSHCQSFALDVNDLGCEYRGSEVPVEADAELKPWE
jgi:hypothetical protein